MSGVSIVLAAGATFCVSTIVLRSGGPMAEPVPDRWHRKSTPLSGGVALLAGFLAGLAIDAADGISGTIVAVALAGAAAWFLGFCDDKGWIGARTKLEGQILIALATAVVIHPAWAPASLAIPVSAAVLVAAMNSFNLLDNIDGLAAGTAAIAAGSLALTTVFVDSHDLRLTGCAVAGSCLGFLPLNYRRRRPAALFMGDAGSHLLGIVVGSTALLATPTQAGTIASAVLAPILILALPIVDTAMVIVVRIAERRPIWRGGRDHLSHRLVYMGLGERAAVAALFAVSITSSAVAVAVAAVGDALFTGAAVGIVFALLVGLATRLALVREAAPRAIGDTTSPAADSPLRREEAAQPAAVLDLSAQPQAHAVEDRASAS